LLIQLFNHLNKSTSKSTNEAANCYLAASSFGLNVNTPLLASKSNKKDILKRLDDFDFVEEVSGDYTGTLTGLGASHDSRRNRD
jgi:hypothetical protein